MYWPCTTWGPEAKEIQQLGALDVGDLPQTGLPLSTVDTNESTSFGAGVAEVFDIGSVEDVRKNIQGWVSALPK